MVRILRKASELMPSISSKVPVDQLRVGMTPASLMIWPRTGVPSSLAQRLSSVSTYSVWMRYMSSRNAFASPTFTDPVPRMAIALSFLWPQRAP